MPNIPTSGQRPGQKRSGQDQAEQQVLFDKVNELQQHLLLSDMSSRIEQTERETLDAERDLERIRTTGHRFDADLEEGLKKEKANLEKARGLLNRRYDDINRRLRPELDSVMQQLQSASRSGWNVASLKQRVERSEKELDRIRQELEDATRNSLTPLTDICRRVRSLAWAYRQLEEASFKKEGDEELVSAWEAQWLAADEKSGPWGVLYLTTKRLIFERKEKVKTGGFLSKKELRQQLAFWQSIEDLERSLDTEKRKFLGKKELLNLEFKKGEPLKASMRLKTDSEAADRRIEDFIAGRLT